ncbi:MAG TPA: dihydrofolate reductase family protein [Chloroflexota bacterium]
MRKLIMWNMVTLDGFFEGANKWDIDWHNRAWGDELEQLSTDQLQSADMLLFGRVTYQGMAGYWPAETGDIAEFMNKIAKVVFSRTLQTAEWNNTRIASDAATEIARLKGESGKDMFIFGSADLCASLMAAGLIDEFRLGVAPIVLGNGNPLFKPMPSNIPLKLLEARTLKTGCVILRYAPE